MMFRPAFSARCYQKKGLQTGAFETEVRSGEVKDGAGSVVAVVSVARVVGDQPFDALLRAYLSPEERRRARPRDVLAAALHGARRSSDLRGVAVQVRSGEIVKELRAAAASRDDARPLFVLPSQLNACEYPSHNRVVEHVADYLHDNTGGPRGQLACHPAVAQALLDAAASDRSPNGFHGLHDALLTLQQHGWEVKNGYLQFPNFGTRASLHLDAMLKEWARTVGRAALAVAEKVQVAGLDERLQWPAGVLQRKVGLAYASAAPVCSYLNVCHPGIAREAQEASSCLLVAAQYLAALQHAAATADSGEPRRVVLMPLGCGVFENSRRSVALALLWAVSALSEAERSALRVELLCWERKPEEALAFRTLLA